MRDFPIFTTEYGVSSLVLKEIPYRKTAYIYIRDVQTAFFQEHLLECAKFCRIAGAERIFAAGDEKLGAFPLYTSVYEMRGPIQKSESTASLFPATKETAGKWRALYNEAMATVDNAATMESRDEGKIAQGAYFVHDAGKLLGIGWVEENRLLAIAAQQKGAGEQVLLALMELTDGEQMTLEVASTNIRAIAFYERMGFIKTAELRSWYDVSSIVL